MADIVTPDTKLIELRRKLSQAKTVAERTDIANQIAELEATIAAQPSGSAVIEASKGGVSPAVSAPESFKGNTVLSPTDTEGVYFASKYDPKTGQRVDLSVTDTGTTQFGAQGTTKKLVLFDAEGKELSASDLAQTAEGKKMAAAGYDIGYGPGKVGPGAADYATGYIAPGTTDYNVMMGLDPLTGQPIEEVKAGRAKYTDPRSGKVVTTDANGKLVYADGTPYTGSSSTLVASTATGATAEQRSAYALLREQFSRYGLDSLVPTLESLVAEGLAPAEFTLRLRETDAYKKRFAANAQRIAKGLRALSEAEYIGLEDQYQNVMRNYGLPESYYTKGDMGTQAGFEKFLAGDVSAAELEDRIQTAQNRVLYANPEVATALKQFYPDITNGDILAYALDPQQALTNIKRKVTAAEIGAEAVRAGLSQSVGYAEELQRYGVTKETAQQGFQAIAGFLPRASTLGDIYAKQGMGPYTQTTAEQEVFGLPSAAEAAQKRRKLTELEQASFSGSAGRAGGALARERAGQF